MSKTTRKVTVDTSRRSSVEGGSNSVEYSSKSKKKSVFDRLGTAGASSYEPEPCRTFLREGDCPYGNKCKFSHNIDKEMTKYKKDRYRESDDGGYQDTQRSPENKRGRRKVQDGDRLKIEFKKDQVLKKKQTISELYEEEIPMRRMKKEKERKEKELHSKLKMGDEMMVSKDEHVRNIQLKGEEKKDRKSRPEPKEDDDSQLEASASRKSKKRRRHEESEEEVSHKEKAEAAMKKKKKKKDRTKHESTSSESESEREREKKKKGKKDKHKSYESDDSGNVQSRKKSKIYEYEEAEERKAGTESKKKKKKKKDKYESESEDLSERESFHGKRDKADRSERSQEEEKSKKSRKIAEEEIDSSKQKRSGEERKARSSSRKESQKGKEKLKRSTSYSSLSSGSSLGEEEDEGNFEYQKKSKKGREYEKESREEKKNRSKKREKQQDERGSHLLDDPRDGYGEERRKDVPPESYPRDPYSQHQESRYEQWERDRPIEQTNQYGSPYYGRSRGPEPFRGRYEPPVKGSAERDRSGYRQYQEGGYGSDQARYRDRGNREPYPYQNSRRGGYGMEDEGFAAGRSRDAYPGAQDVQQGYTREEKQGQRHRDYAGQKTETEEFDERGRRKSGHRASRERKDYEVKSPKRRSRSPKEGGRDNSKDRLKSKKRKREEESPMVKEHSVEKRNKKPKVDLRSESDGESGPEGDQKSEKNRKNADAEKRDGSRRNPRDGDNYQKRDEFSEEKRKSEQRSKGREKERDRGTERDRDRDRRNKPGSNGDRSRNNKPQPKADKRSNTPSTEENRAEKAEDKRPTVSKLASQRHNLPSRRSDAESGSKSQRRRVQGRGGQDGQDVNLDDVYEKISDDELDFFEEENSKVNKPASLEDLDWGALAAIPPPSKKDDLEEGVSPRSMHSSLNVLKSIGFSANLLQGETLKKIQQKLAESGDQTGKNEDEITDTEMGTAALVANKMRNRSYHKKLIANLVNQGTVLSMRKDISVRKELRVPPNRLSMNYRLYCNAPSVPADRELFLASAALYKKIIPGEAETTCKIIPSVLGSVVHCVN